MSIFYRSQSAAVEQRALEWPASLPPLTPTNYATVNPTQGLTAMQSVAIWATADLIASTVSELPIDVFSGRVRRSTPSNLDDPGDDQFGREDWAYRLLMSWLIRGNAYGFENSWDMRGRALSIDLLGPGDVRAQVVDNEPQWYFRGRRIEGDKSRQFRHLRANPQPGVLLGLSVIEAHAVSIGISLRSAQFGDQWFREGAHPSSALVNKAPLSNVDAGTAKKRLIDATQGSREPLVLGEGWEFHNLQLNPEESQFIQTQGYAEAQCARMYGPGYAEVMGYESGGSMTYANVVDRRQDLLVLSLNRWVRRYERVLTSLLPPNSQTVKADRDALLEATTKERYETHALALNAKWKTINEVRANEDMDPVPWGDEPVQTNPTQGVTSGNAAQS